ncbi:DUF87 domain-containing protein [Halogeometricum borinquense]|uniref:DUF87 domain-containing protein n=1 Tax=Halogeometricum borinquense TaxID=60847 RepID=A0A6C0UIK3_9EURY|nr:ATP-binding protein [Halogeometricum borinquense]QIB75394.1 DUF87 domain-containing protein [Halogeometricum borinquense]
MTGSIQQRLPGDVKLAAKFYGLFTAKDLVRLGAPILVAFAAVFPADSLTDIGVIVAAVVTGLVLAVVKPAGHSLDQHALNGVRYLTGGRESADPVTDVAETYVETESAVYAVLEVSATNLEMMTAGEQAAIHSLYQDLANMAEWPIHIHSQQRRIDLRRFTNNIRRNSIGVMDSLRTPYLSYVTGLGQHHLVETRHHVILRVPFTDDTTNRLLQRLHGEETNTESGEQRRQDNAVTELNRRAAKLTSQLGATDIEAHRITGTSLRNYTRQFQFPATHGLTRSESEDAPADYQHQKSLHVTDYPSRKPLAWPTELLHTGGLIDITQTIRPQDAGDTATKLSRIQERLDAEIASTREAGRRGTNTYEARHADADWMLNLIADGSDLPHQYGVTVTVHGPTEDTVDATIDRVTTRLRTMQLEYQSSVLTAETAYRVWHPFRRTPNVRTVLMPGQSVAAGFPFDTAAPIASTGVVYGEHGIEGTPVLLDRFTWDAGHVARMGRTGSGKSFATKLELIRAALAYPELCIYVVDPKQEYGDLIEALGGEMHTLQTGADIPVETRFAGFTVAERGERDNTRLLTRVVEELYRATSQDERRTLVYIDEAHNLMQTPHSRSVLSTFIREARDTNTAVTLITQNAADLTEYSEGRAILDNTPGRQFFFHQRVPGHVQDYFGLSNREVQALHNLRTGSDAPFSESLITVPGRLNARVKVKATMAEYRLIAHGRVVS